jgi:hypothetical protein
MSHCEDCRFYTPFPDRPGWGYCRRYPPSGWRPTSFSMTGEFLGKVALKSARTEELRARYEGKIKGMWEQPQMEPQDWCGEYRSRTETEPGDLQEPAAPVVQES